MFLTPDDLRRQASLIREPERPQATPQPAQSMGSRVAAHAYNFPKSAALALGGMGSSVWDMMTGTPSNVREYEAEEMERQRPEMMYQSAYVAPPRTAGEFAVDVVGNVAPELPALMAPAGMVGRAARLFGAARSAPVIGDVAAGAISGYRDSAAEAGLQAGEFGAQGAIGAMLPQRFRPLTRALGEGAAGYGVGLAGQAMRGNDPLSMESQVQASTMAAFPVAMHGARRLFQRSPRADIAPEAPGSEAPMSPEPQQPTGGFPADWRLRSRAETPEGRYEHVFETPGGEQRMTVDRPMGGEPSRRMFQPTVGDDLGTLPRGEGDVFAGLGQRPPAFDEGKVLVAVKDDAGRISYAQEGEHHADLRERLFEAGRLKSKKPDPARTGYVMAGEKPSDSWFDMRAFEESQGDFASAYASRQKFSNQRTSVEPEGTGARAVTTETPVAPGQGGDIVPAIRLEGEVIRGNPGETHRQIFDRATEGFDDARKLDANMEFDHPRSNPNFFVDSSGAELSRGQLKERFGVSDSQGLRALSRQGGSISPRLLASLAGATAGYAIDEEKGALIGATAGLAGPAMRRLFRRLPNAEQAARNEVTPLKGKTLFGKGVRLAEKYFKKGRDPKLDVIQEQARGTVHTLASDVGQALETAVPHLKTLTPNQRKILKTFMSSDRGPGAKALLATAGLPREVADFVDIATQRKGDLQQIVADAQGDPSRRKLIQDTIGTYVTEPYRAYVSPKEWQKGDKSRMVKRLIDLNMRDPAFKGMSRDKVTQDVHDWITEVSSFGGDSSRMQGEGKTRMSASLFTARKQLRPIVQKILGKIHDPIEREVLTVAKLVKSATTAKVVSEVLQTKDSRGMEFAMPFKDWEAQIQAARAAGDTARVSELEGYSQMPDTLKGLGALSGKGGDTIMAQRHVKDMLQAGVPHGNVDWEKGWLGLFSIANKLPKAAFTLYNPGTWAHNFVQAPLQAVSAGMAPWSFVSNLRRLHKDPAKLRWAKEDGIMDAHMGAGEFRRAADQYEKVLNPGKLEPVRRLHEAVKAGYGKPDQWVRGAAYLKFLDEASARGMAPKEARQYAVENTNRYTQNYSNVAPAVGVLRNVPLVNPFISYTAEMARIIKNLADDVVNNKNGRRIPSALALTTILGLGSGIKQLARLTQSEEEKAGLDSMIPLMPNYAKGKTTVDFGWDAEKQTGKSLNLNPWLPAEDFITTARNILNGEWDAVADTNPIAGISRTPALNLFAEARTGKDPVTGAPSGGALSALRKNALPPLFPGNYTYEKVKQGFTPNEEGGLGVADQYGRRETPATAAGRLFGVSVTTNDKRRLMQRRQTELKEEDRQAKIRMNRVLRSTATPAAKEEAKAEYQETRRRIFQR